MRLRGYVRPTGLILIGCVLVFTGCATTSDKKSNQVERAVPAATRSTQPPGHISPAKPPMKRGSIADDTSLPAGLPPKPVKPPSIEGSGG